MTTQEKILELLSKETLTNDENVFLKEKINNDPALTKYEAIYNLIRDMKNNFHLNSDLISEYVLFNNNLPLEDNSIIKFIPQIENHISKCSKCQEEFELFNEEYNEIDNYVGKKFEQKNETVINSGLNKPAKIFNLFTTKYIFASAAIIAFFSFSLFSISELTSSSYKSISELSELTNYSTTRGRVSSNFHYGVKALSNENYTEAIALLKTDIKNNSSDETIFYTNYMLGLIYLKKSESDFLGLFHSFNETDIDSSIANFEQSISKNNSGSFSNINDNAYFYIGKGYLIEDNFKEAKKYLQIVVNKKGSYSKQAKELLEIIEQKM
ncbi:MAG: hypothetical protein PF445_01095 [Melioribacteraceae bacterium]|jgi:tetratricopeptide (TPR) repeat protein|nr:hypothetical protein [Melioribacteraceae bacterium]